MNSRYTLVIVALALIGTVQSVAAEETTQEDCKFTRTSFEMTIPCEWKTPQEADGGDPIVIDLGDDAGHLRIYFSEETASLRKIARKMRKTARVERWKLRSRRRVRIDGNRALATLFDIRKGALKTRQLFYFFNVDDGRYILHFGAHSKRFDYRRFRRVAASFKRRIQSAQVVK
ncbi:MAG TPA: hypothetical protein EYN66_04650 [Myxococcales bacterium]|nr:hypothetical protein [Myxococcales bacterium]